MKRFWATLAEQRWDDHRYYHHNRINRSLHLVSAISFLCSYVLVFTNPVAAALVGWLFAMITRQVGHFFFEPKGYDEANQATHEHKEAIKVGYNLRRKVVLLSIWILSPLAVAADPSLLGVLDPQQGVLHNVCVLWIALGAAAVLFRTVQLFFLKDVTNGLAWLAKILTDPFHDIALYHRAPLQVLRGELYDPIAPRHAAGA